MKAPDKIYLYREKPKDYFNEDWHELSASDVENIEYIRKDALLEWATTNLDKLSALSDNDAVRWGQRNAFQQMIDKLNQM